jgi:hypothetical protein
VIVDKFTKLSHFIALAHPYTTSLVASMFIDVVYKLHGLPATIVSDRDPVFTSRFWQHLFKLAGTSLHMSSSYHPQTNEQTEHANQCLETFLRCCFVHAYPKKWKHWLSTEEFWYNISFHPVLGKSPFEAMFGRHPRVLGIAPQPAAIGNLEEWLAERTHMNNLIRQYLCRAQHGMKR